MTTTLAQLRADVKLAFLQRGDVDSQVEQWLNDAQLAMASSLRIRELEAASTMTLVNLPVTDIYLQPTDLWAPIILVNTSKRRMEIKFKPLEVVLTRLATPVGDPSEVAIRGTTFIFRPAPKDADVVELTYKIKVPPMSSVVNMTLPDEFRPVLVLEAVLYGMHMLQEEDRAAPFIQMRNEKLAIIGNQRGEEFFARQEGAIIQWDTAQGTRQMWPSYR